MSVVVLKRRSVKLVHTLSVTRGLDPRVHPLRKWMDCRVKPGNDPYRRRFRNVFFHAMVSISDFSASLVRTTLPSSATVKRCAVFSSSV